MSGIHHTLFAGIAAGLTLQDLSFSDSNGIVDIIQVQFGTSGIIAVVRQSGSNSPHFSDWYLPNTVNIANSYAKRISKVTPADWDSHFTQGETENTWVGAGSQITVSLDQSSTRVGQIFVEIGPASNLTTTNITLASATYTFTLTVP